MSVADMPSHAANLERVIVSISPTVLAFCRQILRDGRPQFNMRELTAYVRRCVGEIAPDSAGRILRELRLRKHIEYKVINRRASLYELTAVQS